MKLAIFGGTGKVGAHLVQQALEAGHEVRALVRTPAKMTIQHARLMVVQGDAMNAADVEATISGSDVVLSALGHGKNTPPDMQAVSTRHIIASMEKHGIKRLISLTGGGVRHTGDQPKLIDGVMRFLLKTINGTVLQDAVDHAEIIKASTLEWVVVRAPMIVEGERTGKYNVGLVGTTDGIRITRADVADFMLKQIDSNAHLRKMPMLGSQAA